MEEVVREGRCVTVWYCVDGEERGELWASEQVLQPAMDGRGRNGGSS